MTARRLTILAAVAGLLTLAACGEDAVVTTPANAPAQQPAAEATGEAEAFPPHGSPWYPTPAPDTTESAEDPCLDRPATPGIPHRC